MAGLVPAIHVLSRVEDVDPRNKSGDDEERTKKMPGTKAGHEALP
jgi:hypothetical protein